MISKKAKFYIQRSIFKYLIFIFNSEMLFINKKNQLYKDYIHFYVLLDWIVYISSTDKQRYPKYVTKNDIKCFVCCRFSFTNCSKFSGIYVNYSKKATSESSILYHCEPIIGTYWFFNDTFLEKNDRYI